MSGISIQRYIVGKVFYSTFTNVFSLMPRLYVLTF